jgi:hypothetical protein
VIRYALQGAFEDRHCPPILACFNVYIVPEEAQRTIKQSTRKEKNQRTKNGSVYPCVSSFLCPLVA